MKRQCAWCRKWMGDPESDATEDRTITHGICDECLSNLDFQQGVALSRFLDSLSAPILVCDEHDAVQMLNRAACALLGIDPSLFTAKTKGLVFECQHARYPAGCGRTLHCSGCAIRIAIDQTAATGRGVLRQPATWRQNDRDVRLLITTEKVGNMILLRIDEVTDTQADTSGDHPAP